MLTDSGVEASAVKTEILESSDVLESSFRPSQLGDPGPQLVSL